MPDLTVTRLAGTPEAGTLLVAGPSLGTSVAALWGRCAALLGNGVEVVGWDLPGHGASTPASTPFTIGDLANVVRGVAFETARGRRAFYAGNSVGGAVAFELGMEPGPFDAVAALGAAPKIGDSDAWYERAHLVRKEGTSVMVAPSSVRWFAPGFADRCPQVVAELLASLSRTDQFSYAAACEALAAFDLRDGLADTKVPVLIAAGEHDGVVPPAAAEAAASAIPRAVVRVLPGVGHLPPAEDPHAVADMLGKFLATQGGSR